MDLVEVATKWAPLVAYGALAVAIGSVFIAWSARNTGKEALRLNKTEFGWKEEDRRKKLEAANAEAARLAWCKAMQERLDAGSGSLAVPRGKEEWARWGDKRFYVIETTDGGLYLHALGSHIGHLLF